MEINEGICKVKNKAVNTLDEYGNERDSKMRIYLISISPTNDLNKFSLLKADHK